MRHVKGHDADQERLSCSQCPKSYIRKADLKDHVRAVHDEEPGTCSHCGKRFLSRRGIEEHEQKHAGVGLLECAEKKCPKTFQRQASLEGHMNSHRDYKPYRCSVARCKRAFAHRSSLSAHESECKGLWTATKMDVRIALIHHLALKNINWRNIGIGSSCAGVERSTNGDHP